MGAHYLRIEGVNLSAILDDTQDLSTIRGGSLMLLRAVDAVDAWLSGELGHHNYEAVTTGASIGLWRLQADARTAGAVVADLRKALATGLSGLPTGHATFVIDVTPETPGGYPAARETLIAANRWQQMQSATVVYPARQPGNAVCQLDLKRPAPLKQIWIKGEDRYVSPSVLARRTFGLQAKQDFYPAELALAGLALPAEISALGSHPFAYHLRSICEPKRPNLRQSVRDKIAVFYADANGLSGRQNELVMDERATDLGPTPLARQQELDRRLKMFRRDFLHRLLMLLVEQDAIGAPQPEEKTERSAAKASDVVRLETLLWGGDEFMFVLPARLGFQVAQLFFETTRGANNTLTRGAQQQLPVPAPWKLGGKSLEHAAALVFCHHDAPIAALRHLASSQLAEHAKSVDRDQSLLMPIVLESFDHIGQDLDRYFARRLPKGLCATGMPLKPEALAALQELALNCQSGIGGAPLPRGRLRSVVQALHCEDGIAAGAYEKLSASVMAEFKHLVRSFTATSAHMAPTSHSDDVKRAALWLCLEEYWDYLLPDKL